MSVLRRQVKQEFSQQTDLCDLLVVGFLFLYVQINVGFKSPRLMRSDCYRCNCGRPTAGLMHWQAWVQKQQSHKKITLIQKNSNKTTKLLKIWEFFMKRCSCDTFVSSLWKYIVSAVAAVKRTSTKLASFQVKIHTARNNSTGKSTKQENKGEKVDTTADIHHWVCLQKVNAWLLWTHEDGQSHPLACRHSEAWRLGSLFTVRCRKDHIWTCRSRSRATCDCSVSSLTDRPALLRLKCISHAHNFMPISAWNQTK